MLRTNLVTNPSFGTNAENWLEYLGCTIARSSAQAFIGTHSLQVTATGADTIVSTASTIAVVGSADYALQVRARAATFARNIILGVLWYDAGGSNIPTLSIPTVLDGAGAWSAHSRVFTAPSNAKTGRPYVRFQGAPGEVHYFDAVMFEQASLVGDYFDGDSTTFFEGGTPTPFLGGVWPPGQWPDRVGFWDGSPHASVSREIEVFGEPTKAVGYRYRLYRPAATWGG